VQRYVPPHHLEAMEATEGQHQKDARKSEVGAICVGGIRFHKLTNQDSEKL